MSKLKRNYRSNSEKVAVVREHLLEKVSVSEVCKRHGVAPSQFYAWQKQLFEGGALAFGPKGQVEQPAKEERKLKKRIEKLESLHSAIGYIATADMLAGRQDQIHAARDKKLEQAREQRKQLRAQIQAAA